MKVKYKISETIFEALKTIFLDAKEIEDTYDMAKIVETNNEIIYRTCCRNKWIIGFNGELYFGYEGTRNGFSRAQPFWDSMNRLPRFYLDYYYLDSKELVICIREDYLHNPREVNDEDVEYFTEVEKHSIRFIDEPPSIVEFKYHCYILKKIIEYQTTLPADLVHPLDTIETLLLNSKKAIIMRGKTPLMIIDYKIMYPRKTDTDEEE
ncbi:MAG: hypothetical protein QXY26_09880 [Ignisphaera sp.]